MEIKKMIISYSELYKFQTCKRAWYYSFYKGLSSEATEAVDTGNKGHALLQSFYNLMQEGKTKEEALFIVRHQASDKMKQDRLDFNLVTAWTVIENYIKVTDFTADAILVENRFLIPADGLFDSAELTGVQIGFTPDVVFKRKSDKIDVEDSKFVQRAWSAKKLDRFTQTKVYQIFLEYMGYEISRSIVRFFNVKNGSLTHKIYELGSAEKVILKRELKDHILDLVRYKGLSSGEIEASPRTLNYSACQFCDFNFPCTLEAQGKDATKTLALYDKRRYDYSV